MLELITTRSGIRQAQRKLSKDFASSADSTRKIKLGYRHGSFEVVVHWHKDLEVWGTFNDHPIGSDEERYWNGFGTIDPELKQTQSIGCEINPPHEGIERRVAGGFAQDAQTGDLFLVHRGNIAGGRKGISKTGFWKEWDVEQSVEVVDGDSVARVALVARLGDAALPAQIALFVHEVAELKSRLASPTGPSVAMAGASLLSIVGPEFEGTKVYGRSAQQVRAAVNHGLVVNGLLRELRAAGHDGRRDRYRDAFTVAAGQLKILYEVKTGTDPQSIYTGLGQLFMHGRLAEETCRLVLVLPSGKDAGDWRGRIHKLGIDVLEYSLDGKAVSFSGVPEMMS